jgi:hypothetical protein
MVHAIGGEGRALGSAMRRVPDCVIRRPREPRCASTSRCDYTAHWEAPFKGAGTSNTVDGGCQGGTRVISPVRNRSHWEVPLRELFSLRLLRLVDR